MSDEMKPFYDRVKWNLRHLFDFKTPNPYVGLEEHGTDKPRIAIVDLGHSLVNVWKEWRRLKRNG